MKIKKEIKIFSRDLPIIQFFIPDDKILRMFVTERSGLFTIPLNTEEEMHFLADLDYKLDKEVGTVYKFKGIHKIKRA